MKNLKPKGFVALMATIVISLVLLVMVVQEGSAGFYARFNILGTEAKEQASALAEGCAEQATAALVTDPYFAGDSTSTTAGGVCHIFPILFNAPTSGLVTIKTQAQVRDSFANLESVMNLNNVHLGSTPAAPTRGTLMVYTHVVNDNGGTKAAADFTENVAAGAPSKFLFAGDEAGVPVTMNPGSYSISENSMTNYAETLSAGCSGTIAAGEVKSCVVTNDDVITTLTVIANVINNNSGARPLSDFTLTIDGAAAVAGKPIVVTVGSHTVAGPTFAGYSASAWGYDCGAGGTVTVNSGNNKTCIITYDDNPPAPPVCADTVMMLDRSGSMFTNSAWIPDEKTAANTLVDLYAGVTPSPKVGFGRFGDVATGQSAEVVSPLQTAYAAIKTAINNGLPQNPGSNTNLADAISFGSAELNSTRHDPTKQKVLILVSDGEPNRPTGSITVPTNVSPATVGSLDTWSANTGTKIAAVAADDGSATYITTPSPSQTFKFQPASVPPGATSISVALHAQAKQTGGTAGNITLTAENGASQTVDGGHALSNSYADYIWNMSTNPLTGGAWTIAEVNNWTQNFGVSNASTGSTIPRVTQLSEVVSYTSASTTPLRAPAAAVTPNNWSNPTRAFISDNSYSTDSTNGHTQGFNNFGLNVPTGSTITGIEVAVEAKAVGGLGIGCSIGVELSSNGSTYTSSGNSSSINSSESVDTLGGSSSLWGRSWTPADFNSSTFSLRVLNNRGPLCGATTNLDQVAVRVYFSTSGTFTLAPALTGNLNGWSSNSGITISAVAANDSDTTYISNSAAVGQTQSFTLVGAGVPATASSISVTLHAVAQEVGGSSGNIQLIVEKGGPSNVDSGHNLTGSFVDYTRVMATNPFGGVWTPAEVNNWTTKFGVLNNSGAGSVAYVTQLYATVSYTVITDPTAAAYTSADAAKQSGTQIFTIHFGDAAGRDLLAKLASGTTANGTHQSGSFYDPAGVVTGSVTSSPALSTAPNQFTNSDNAFASDNQYTTETTNGQQQGFKGFTFALPPAATINGIQIDTEAKSSRLLGCQVGVEVSSDGGATWTSSGNKNSLISTGDRTYTLGDNSALWGRSWTVADFSSGNFAVRLQNIESGFLCPTGTLSVDQVQAKVYYTVITENGDGDNFFIAPTSADMAGIFNFIGSQVCPAANAPAVTAPPTTATLIITTNISNNDGTGNKIASDFSVSVNALNPSQSSFAGSMSGVSITVDPGAYSITESPVSGYTESPGATCSSGLSGPLVAGETRVCTLNNDDIPPPPAPPNLTITTGSTVEVPAAH